MTRTVLRTFCAAGLLLPLGCRGTAPELVPLPGGETPSSYAMRPAAVPSPGDPPLIVPAVYKARNRAPALVAGGAERRGLSPPSGPPLSTRRLEPAEAMNAPPPSLPPLLAAPEPAPVCGHAADHRWLVGCLRHEEERDRWTVRYADPGAGDRYGGELELLHPGPMRGFYPGQMVRVEGDLVDPEPLQTQPAYRVRSLQLVPRGG